MLGMPFRPQPRGDRETVRCTLIEESEILMHEKCLHRASLVMSDHGGTALCCLKYRSAMVTMIDTALGMTVPSSAPRIVALRTHGRFGQGEDATGG